MDETRIFTTDEVVRLLGLKRKDTWRVIKFAQSREYGIVPSLGVARGQGTRRLYNLENVLEMALALRLLDIGLRPSTIGDVFRHLRKMGERLSEKLLTEQIARNSWLCVGLHGRLGGPLKENRVSYIRFNPDPILMARYVEAHFPDTDVLLVFIGPMFQAILIRLVELDKKRGNH